MADTNNQKFYGWISLTGAMLTYLAFGGCILYSYGVFLPSMCTDLAASRTALSAPYSLVGLIQGFFGPLAGISVSKFGARKNIIFGNLLGGLCLIGLAFVTEIWQLYVLFILMGPACSFGTFNPATTIANNWFIKRRTLAMSLVVSALGIGGFAFPLLITWLISTIGWRSAWVVLGSILLLFSVIISGIIIRNKPEDLGQVPDGVPNTKAGNMVNSKTASPVYQTPVDWNVKDALKSLSFWMILAFAAINTFNVQFFTTHEVIYLQDKGFNPVMAASGLSLLVIISAGAKLLMGGLGTKFNNRYLAIISMSITGIGVFTLMQVTDIPVLYLSSILIGLGYGGNVILYPSFVSAYFGRKNYSRIMGLMSPFTFLLAATAPIIAASIFDSTGSYFWAFLITLSLIGIAVFCVSLARPPKPRTEIG